MTVNAESAIEWAMEIADNLPEKYQVAAFAELLRHALTVESSVVERSEAGSSQPSSQPLRERLVNELPDEYLVARNGSRDQQTVWAVIKLWHQGEEIIPASVMDFIRTHLCIQPEGQANTSTRLRKLAPRYLTRQERETGQGYEYEPTFRAIEVFEGLEE